MNRGLSPRVRGNLTLHSRRLILLRSIPACTGEPNRLGLRFLRVRVYPRVYGGTRRPRDRTSLKCGLSPRVRGNLRWHRDFVGWWRSIPACTGEPKSRAVWIFRDAVYPRVYGGTAVVLLSVTVGPGLSPRVRGNLYAFQKIVSILTGLLRPVLFLLMASQSYGFVFQSSPAR